MAKQTRRSISIRGESYEKLRSYCNYKNISMSSWLEEQVALTLRSELVAAEFTAKVFSSKVHKPSPAKKVDKEPIRGGGTHLI